MPGQKQIKTKRLTASDRREQIIQVASLLFAKKGLHGVTTKEIAKACKISEPVLYRHFSSKDQLYKELHVLCQGQTTYMIRVLKTLPEGSSTLVVGLYLLCYAITLNKDPSNSNEYSQTTETLTRLMGYSFLEDGRFAKALVKDCVGSVMPYLKKSFNAAQKRGDIDSEVSEKDLWLVYESIISSSLFHMPKPHLITSLQEDDVLLESLLKYILRGIGMKKELIHKNCNMKKLKRWIALPSEWKP